MSILDLAKADIQQITSDTNGFGVTIILTAPNSSIATITGLHTKIGLNVDTEGNAIAAKKAHVSFAEKLLTDAGYPIRNSGGEVSLVGHIIEVADSTGSSKKYTVLQCYPDETIGLLTCSLEDFE